MLRFLALLLLAVLVVMALRALVSNLRLAGRHRTSPRSASTAPGATAGRPAGEPLVRCDRCGVRFPAHRALPGPPVPGGPVPGRFCSAECRDGGPAAASRERSA